MKMEHENLKVVSFTPGEPDADLIETLEELLESAKAGKMKSVAFCFVAEDASVHTGWSGRRALPLCGAIYLLNARYAKSMLEDSA